MTCKPSVYIYCPVYLAACFVRVLRLRDVSTSCCIDLAASDDRVSRGWLTAGRMVTLLLYELITFSAEAYITKRNV